MSANHPPAPPRDSSGSVVDSGFEPLIDRFDLRFLIARHRKVLLLLPILCMAVGFAAFLQKEKLYESSALLLVDSTLDQLLQFEPVETQGQAIQESLKSLEVAVVADSVMLRVVDKLGLRNAPGYLPADLAAQENLPDGKLLKFLRGNRVKASLQPETRLIRISALDPDAERARLVAETLVEEFELFLADQRRLEVRKARASIEEQVEEAKRVAYDAEERLKKFREESGNLETENGQGILSERLAQFGTDLNTAARERIEIGSLHHSLSTLDAQTAAIDIIEVAGYRNDGHISNLLTSLATARSKLAAAKQQYTASHPMVLSADAEVAIYETQIQEVARDIQSTVTARHNAAIEKESLLKEELEKVESEFVSHRSTSAEFRALQEQAETSWLHYKSLEKRLSDNIISTEMPGRIATVVSEPLTPYKVAGPSLLLFLFAGGIAGSFLAVTFLGSRVLSGIPYTSAQQLRARFQASVTDWTTRTEGGSLSVLPSLLSSSSRFVQISESGKALDSRKADPSAMTHTVNSLASLASTRGKKTLLIHVSEQGSGEPGIVPAAIPNLSLLNLSGDDFYDESRFASVSAKLSNSFDKILIDSTAIADPTLIDWISKFCQVELIVVIEGESTKASLTRHLSSARNHALEFLFVPRPSGTGSQLSPGSSSSRKRTAVSLSRLNPARLLRNRAAA